MKVINKVIVVTGAGSGMGRELTLNLIAKGAKVAAIDINENNLKETVALVGSNKDAIASFVVDISNRNSVEEFLPKVIALFGHIDGLINNAGIIQPFVKLNDLSYEAINRVININLYGTIYMVKTFLPHLLTRPEAHIANISSMGGFLPVPGQTIYGASKAAVKLMSEGLNSELLNTSVRVTVVFPGAVSTNISQNSGLVVPASASSEPSSFKMLSASKAAQIIVDGIEANKYHVFVGSDSKFMDLICRISPKRAAKFIYSKMKTLLPKN